MSGVSRQLNSDDPGELQRTHGPELPVVKIEVAK